MEQVLRRALHHRPDVELRILPDGQFVIRHGMAANPAAIDGAKATSEVPGKNGFQIYLAIRPGVHGVPGAQAAAAMPPPMSSATPLHLEEGQGGGTWHFPTLDGGALCVLRITAGEQAPLDTINDLLQEIHRVLR